MNTMKPAEIKTSKVNSWVDQVKDFTNEEKKVSLLEEFTQNATVHGLRHTSSGRHCRFRRGFWAVAFLCMLAGLFYTVFSQVATMMTYPTIMQQRMEFKPGLPFPAVTLCNLNQFRKSVLGDDKRTQLVLFAMSDLATMGQRINWSDPLWNYNNTEYGDLSDDLLAYMGHPAYLTLKFCSWDNKPFNCLEGFKTQKTDFGMCYTFNAGDNLNTTPLTSARAGSKYGLTIVADIMQGEYMLGQNSDVAGLRVVLHDPLDTPLVEGMGFDVGPGMATKASLLYKQVNYLPPPYTLPYGDQTTCTDQSSSSFENLLKLYDRYDLMACVSECRQNLIAKTCGCKGIFDRGNQTWCHPKEFLECYRPTFENFMYNNLAWNCSCPLPCSMNLFEAKTSAAEYPSTALMEQIQTMFNVSITENEFRRNFLKLTLAYDYFLMESINQVPEFNFESIMSTLGGQLGIFLGASLLSLLEFLEFGLELFFFKLLRIGNKTKPGS